MNFGEAQKAANAIRVLATRAMKPLSTFGPAYIAASTSALRPITYMRYAEFEAVLAGLTIRPGMTVLDASSPQWLTLYLATHYPETSFVYPNIIDEELDPYREIAGALGITNIRYVKGDLRDLEFSDGTVDRAISVSVIEHVYPEIGGDVAALQELKRVLKADGEFAFIGRDRLAARAA